MSALINTWQINANESRGAPVFDAARTFGRSPKTSQGVRRFEAIVQAEERQE